MDLRLEPLTKSLDFELPALEPELELALEPAPVLGLVEPVLTRECPREGVAPSVPVPVPASAEADVSKLQGFVWSTYRVIVEPWLMAELLHLSIPDSCHPHCTGTLQCIVVSCHISCTDDVAVTRTHMLNFRCPFE